jgi:DNA polymerase I
MRPDQIRKWQNLHTTWSALPVCMVARELHTGGEIRLWRSELLRLRAAPFGIGDGAVFLAYFASAELGCFLELGWPLPTNVVDLFVEHRCETNGVPTICGDGLVPPVIDFAVNL